MIDRNGNANCPHLVTALPGPKAKQLVERDQPNSSRPPIRAIIRSSQKMAAAR